MEDPVVDLNSSHPLVRSLDGAVIAPTCRNCTAG